MVIFPNGERFSPRFVPGLVSKMARCPPWQSKASGCRGSFLAHNLHNYDELGVSWQHWPFHRDEDVSGFQRRNFPQITAMISGGGKLLIHQEELGDNVCGLIGAYLLWSGLVDNAPDSVTILERMVQRQLGPHGREIVAVADRLVSRA